MTKKKLLTIIISLSCIIFVLAATLVVVIVAQSLQATSSIKVSYRAEEVTCTASAKYYKGSQGSGVDLVSDADYTSTVLSFAPNVKTTGTLVAAKDPNTNESEIIQLDKNSASIVFEYLFVNQSSTVDILIELDTSELSVSNMTVKYCATTTKQSDYTVSSFTDSLVDKETFDSQAHVLDAVDSLDSEMYIYIVATVDVKTESATYEGDISWNLSRNIES